MSNLSKIKSKLRTQGVVTGNFGKPKVKAGSKLNDLGVTSKESVVIASRESYIQRMIRLYDSSSDVSMKKFAIDELHRLGCFKERRLESIKPTPYKPLGT